jgi:glycosyltransferase involved in cell wall biosynthesis
MDMDMDMDMDFTISIIICAYNAEAFIDETLHTILAQTYPRVEIVVIDDGSTDETAAIVRKLGSKVKFFSQPNTGPSAARNAGIRVATGKLLCFFDADDLMPPTRLAQQADFLQRHPDVHLVTTDYQNFSKQGLADHTHFQTCPLLQAHLQGQLEVVLEDACTILAQENFSITGTSLLRRSLVDLVSGFEPRLQRCEDFHFYFRMARHTRVGIINRVGMFRRIHDNNLSRNVLQMLPNGIISSSLLRDTESNPRVRKLLNARIVSFMESFARQQANIGYYGNALYHYSMALLTKPGLRQLYRTLHGAARTFALALRLHRSKDN